MLVVGTLVTDESLDVGLETGNLSCGRDCGGGGGGGG